MMLVLVVVIVATLHSLTAATTVPVSVDFQHAASPGAVVRAVHGVSMGPKVGHTWRRTQPNYNPNADDMDFVAGFNRTAVPAVRVHGMGCIDMNVLWRPFPAYAGQDPANSSNYNWGIADQCMANVYADPNLPHLRAFVRFGHSRAMVADHPDFCQGPDDLNVFAAVCLAVLHRYRRAMGYQLSDVSVWNEPANEIEQSTSAFYCRDSTRYAAMYAAVYRAIKPVFGGAVRIAVSGGNSNFTRDVLTELRVEPGVEVDMLDVHIYPDQPSAIPWRIYARPDISVESMLEETGWPRRTPIQLGEWSRSIGLNYAFDGPGAAFVACGLAHINALGAANSEHNVELGYLFAASKIWDGTRPASPDINAATVFNWWHQMSAPTGTGTAAGPPRMLATTGTDFTSQSARMTGSELVVVAADRTVDGGGGGEVLVLVSQYTKGPTIMTAPSTLECFDLAVTVTNVPWERWTWTQYANEALAVLSAVTWGCGTGPNATLALQMHGNAYTGISIARAVPATPGAGIAVPAGAANPRFPANSPAYTIHQRAALAAHGCPGRPTSFRSECPADGPNPGSTAAPAPTTPRPATTDLPCPRNCGSVENGGGTCRTNGRCTACNDNRVRQSGRCYTSIACKGRRIQSGSQAGSSCQCLDDHCHYCNRAAAGDVCRVCRDGFYLLDDACVETCPAGSTLLGIGSFKRRCTAPFSCAAGRIQGQNVAYGCKCATDDMAAAACQNCEFRADEFGQHCTRCNGGKFIFESRCQDSCDGTGLIAYNPGNYGRECRAPFTCADRTDEDGNDCKCSRVVGRNNCQACDYDIAGVSCLRCTNSMYLHTGVCVEACPNGTTGVSDDRDGRECI